MKPYPGGRRSRILAKRSSRIGRRYKTRIVRFNPTQEEL